MKQDKRQGLLKQYNEDMLTLNKQIYEAVRRQREDENLKKQGEAHQLIIRLEEIQARHISELGQHLQRLGGSTAPTVKAVVSSALGALTGMYEKVRSDTAPKMLRDDYTACCLAAVSYTMLHTTAMALHEPATAELALRHLNALTPAITEISRILPSIVAYDLLDDEDIDVDTTVASESMRLTQQAWEAHAALRIG